MPRDLRRRLARLCVCFTGATAVLPSEEAQLASDQSDHRRHHVAPPKKGVAMPPFANSDTTEFAPHLSVTEEFRLVLLALPDEPDRAPLSGCQFGWAPRDYDAAIDSAIGIYGVLAYSVAQRIREIGIRMALGAEARDVLRMVLGQGVKVTLIGLAIGAVGAFFLTRAMAAMLFQVRPYDPVVYISTGTVLGAVALIASFIPSLRAVHIEPSVALRQE